MQYFFPLKTLKYEFRIPSGRTANFDRRYGLQVTRGLENCGNGCSRWPRWSQEPSASDGWETPFSSFAIIEYTIMKCIQMEHTKSHQYIYLYISTPDKFHVRISNTTNVSSSYIVHIRKHIMKPGILGKRLQVSSSKVKSLTLELVSTFTSVVMFLFFSWVLTSAKNSSPFLVPDEVMACQVINTWRIRQHSQTSQLCDN